MAKNIKQKLAEIEDEYCEDSNPKIVYYDIETTLGLYWGFDTGKQYVGWEKILKEPVVCCICWAVGDGEVQSATFDMGKYYLDKYDDKSDLNLLKRFSEVANDATLLIGHNARWFDSAFIIGRIIQHHLPPLANTPIDDTYLLTKAVKLQSHSLDYMLKRFGLGRKTKVDLELWKRVGKKDKSALAEMVSYCKNDVIGLRNLYKYLKPYIKSSLNLSSYNEISSICPSCGSSRLQRRGFDLTKVGKYQRYQCTDCGGWSRGGKNLLKKTERFIR